jgi:hypothetical protein
LRFHYGTSLLVEVQRAPRHVGVQGHSFVRASAQVDGVPAVGAPHAPPIFVAEVMAATSLNSPTSLPAAMTMRRLEPRR